MDDFKNLENLTKLADAVALNIKDLEKSLKKSIEKLREENVSDAAYFDETLKKIKKAENIQDSEKIQNDLLRKYANSNK